MPEEEDLFEKYWQLRVDSAHSRIQAALNVIQHNPTRGSMAEGMLRDLIAEYLTSRWNVGTGFVLTPAHERSRQVDILVYDMLANLPLYRDGNLVVLTPGSATAAIEVKTMLNRETLIDESLQNVAALLKVDPSVDTAVFAYRGLSAETLVGHLRAHIQAAKQDGSYHREEFPDNIYVLDQRILFIRAVEGEWTYTVHRPEVPLVRFVITQVLATLKVTNLQPFMKGVEYGDPLYSI